MLCKTLLQGNRISVTEFRCTAGPAEKPFAEFRAFWRAFVAKAFHPYRPELHYMRGPGPAWRAKHTRTDRE